MVSAGLWIPILNASVSDVGEICTQQFRTYAGAPKLFPENNIALQPTLDIQYLVAGGPKHIYIRTMDQSDLGWVVEAYMDSDLASDSDIERKLFKASQEAQQTVKRKQAESAASAVAKGRTISSGEL